MLSKINLKEKHHLPDKLKVNILKSESGGFTAILADYPGCITYADSLSQLIDNLNDAILTYFEVPREEALKANFVYVPRTNRAHKFRLRKTPSGFVPVSPTFSYA